MNNRRVLLIADAGANAGSGHMMRCSAIAGALSDLGVETDLRLLEFTDHSGETVPSAEDLAAGEDCGLILLDSYHTSADEMELLRKKAVLVCMDDTLPFRYPADAVINYNIYAEELPYRSVYSDDVKLLLGSRYLPLREQFRDLPQRESTEDQPFGIRRVLLSTGGSDPFNTASLLLDVLPVLDAAKDLEFILLTGPFNPHLEEIGRTAEKYRNVTVMMNVQDMAGLMRECQLAVSASGTTLWELCASGTPAISYVLADNQIMNARTFDRKRLCLNAGDVRDRDTFVKDLARLFDSCLSMEPEELLDWSRRMQAQADGRGAARIAREIAGML